MEKALGLKKGEKKRGHYALIAPRAEAGGLLRKFGGHTKFPLLFQVKLVHFHSFSDS